MIGASVDLDLNPLENLRGTGYRKAVRIGLNRAAAPVKASVAGHANSIRDTGALSKSIRIRLKVYPNAFVAVIGPSSSYTRQPRGKITRGPHKGQQKPKVRPSKYARLVEKGTKRSRPRPWLSLAHQRTTPVFLARVAYEVEKEVWAELERRKVT